MHGLRNRRGPKPTPPVATKAWRDHRPVGRGWLKGLAGHIGVSKPAISKWLFVPAGRVEAVAAYLGLEPAQLRPDLYPSDPWSKLN